MLINEIKYWDVLVCREITKNLTVEQSLPPVHYINRRLEDREPFSRDSNNNTYRRRRVYVVGNVVVNRKRIKIRERAKRARQSVSGACNKM